MPKNSANTINIPTVITSVATSVAATLASLFAAKKLGLRGLGNVHEVPAKINNAFATALKKYPELSKENIVLRFAPLRTTMAASISVDTILSDTRQYEILINNRNSKDSGVHYQFLTPTMLVGLFGHELAHILHYQSLTPAQMIKLGVKYFLSENYTQQLEADTDAEAIRRGFGNGLEEYKNFVYHDSTGVVPARFQKYYKTNYLPSLNGIDTNQLNVFSKKGINKKIPMKKIDVLKSSLKKKESLLAEKLNNHFSDVKKANGQPLNDKRNGKATLNRWQQQRNAIRALEISVEKTKDAIENEEGKTYEIETTKSLLPQAIVGLINNGTLKQWGKYPNIFFVNGVQKARIVYDLKKKTLNYRYLNQINNSEERKKFAATYNTLFKQLTTKTASNMTNNAGINLKNVKNTDDSLQEKLFEEEKLTSDPVTTKPQRTRAKSNKPQTPAKAKATPKKAPRKKVAATPKKKVATKKAAAPKLPSTKVYSVELRLLKRFKAMNKKVRTLPTFKKFIDELDTAIKTAPLRHKALLQNVHTSCKKALATAHKSKGNEIDIAINTELYNSVVKAIKSAVPQSIATTIAGVKK